MSAPAGEALVAELERRFVVVREPVPLGAETVEILRPRSADELISEDDFARDERLPYWADVWPSGRILAEHLLAGDGHGRCLLELGCGTGLVTVAAMRAGFDVLATDYYDDALRFTRANAWRAVGREPQVRMVDWRALPDDLGTFDCVVAADVLYERPYGVLVARAIARTLRAGGEALVADPGRVGVADFHSECEAGALHVEAHVHRYVAGSVQQRITLFALSRA